MGTQLPLTLGFDRIFQVPYCEQSMVRHSPRTKREASQAEKAYR